ncbi:MAG: DNA primase [bacterium]
MPSSSIDEIKNRLDIVEVVGGYTKLQKAGANYRGICPFHTEKTPSFFVSPTRQIWHCFGSCSEGGDIFKFIMKIEGVEFGDALRILAQRAGVELQRQDPKIKTERQRYYEICNLATQFFIKQIESSKSGQLANEYLLSRGINKESIKKWQIGYAPESPEALLTFLVGRGYKREETEKVGLAVKGRGGQSYDRFRSRIMFPIFDLNSQVIGFGGRVFGNNKDTAKYVNTPNTLLYDKSRVLYGLDKAKMEVRKKDCCILVEGYTDVIMSSQAGVENVAATSGTALTDFQLKILHRYTNNLLTAFDMDVAGNSATKRGVDLAQAQGFNIKVVVMPQEKDPADVIAADPQQWKELTAQGKSILDFYFEITFAKFDSRSPEGKKEISSFLLPQIKKIPNRIEQSYWIQELSKRLGVKEEDIREEMRKCSVPEHFSTVDDSAKPFLNGAKKQRKQLIEEKIVSLLMKNSSQLGLIGEDEISCFSAEIQEVLNYLKKNPDIYIEAAKFLPKIAEKFPQLADKLNHLLFRAEIEEIDIGPEAEILTCLQELKKLGIRDRLDKISLDLKKG